MEKNRLKQNQPNQSLTVAKLMGKVEELEGGQYKQKQKRKKEKKRNYVYIHPFDILFHGEEEEKK